MAHQDILEHQDTAATADSLGLELQDLAAHQVSLVTAAHQVSQVSQEVAYLDIQDIQEVAQADLVGSLDTLVCQEQAQAAIAAIAATLVLVDFRVVACQVTAGIQVAEYQAIQGTADLVLAGTLDSLVLAENQVFREVEYQVIQVTADQAQVDSQDTQAQLAHKVLAVSLGLADIQVAELVDTLATAVQA
jgi:hypothetical protein